MIRHQRKWNPKDTACGKTWQQPWPTRRLTRQHRKTWDKGSKLYLTELGRSVQKKTLFQAYHSYWACGGTTEWNPSLRERKSLLSKKLWFLENRAAVPGMSPMKKRRHKQHAQRQSWRNLRTWLGTWNQNKAIQVWRHAPYPTSGWNWIHAVEASGVGLFQKTGWTSSRMMAHAWLRRGWIQGNGHVWKQGAYRRPGDHWMLNPVAVQHWRHRLSGWISPIESSRRSRFQFHSIYMIFYM